MADMKGIQGELSSMMPQADQSFGQISDLIGGIMSEPGQIPNAELGGVPELNEESMKIIEEASALLEVNTKSKFPDLSFLMTIWLNLLTKKHSLFHTNQEEFQSYLPIFYLIFAHSGAIVNYYYYIAFPKSHAEKNFGVISITTSVPFLVFSIIILARGCSIVPRYFMFIFSTIGKFF